MFTKTSSARNPLRCANRSTQSRPRDYCTRRTRGIGTRTATAVARRRHQPLHSSLQLAIVHIVQAGVGKSCFLLSRTQTNGLCRVIVIRISCQQLQEELVKTTFVTTIAGLCLATASIAEAGCGAWRHASSRGSCGGAHAVSYSSRTSCGSYGGHVSSGHSVAYSSACQGYSTTCSKHGSHGGGYSASYPATGHSSHGTSASYVESSAMSDCGCSGSMTPSSERHHEGSQQPAPAPPRSDQSQPRQDGDQPPPRPDSEVPA